MFRFKILVISIGVFLVVFGCSSDKETQSGHKEIKGVSTMVGNEPFSRIAIIVSPHNVYVINGSTEIKQNLIGHQGMYFNVKYTQIKDSANVHIIDAYEATLSNNRKSKER